MLFARRPRFDWKLRTRSLALGERTLLMAIINLTPDSFSGDGLASATLEDAVNASLAAIDGGADVVDLGAESTRPNARALSSAAEQIRLLPVVEAVLRERPDAVISVDTYHAATARAALHAGAEIINDVSGFEWDPAMPPLIAAEPCGFVMMHTRGKPGEWTSLPAFPGDVAATVQQQLREQVDAALALGIDPARLVVDPGFGFGKRGAENFALLSGLNTLASLGLPVLAGMSRKGFLGDVVSPLQRAGLPPAISRLNATTAANVAAVVGGAHILRVHDLQVAREAAAVADAVLLSAL